MLLWNFFYPFFLHHYAASLTGPVMLIALSGCIYLLRFRWGAVLVAVLLTCSVFRPVRQPMYQLFQPGLPMRPRLTRNGMETRLHAIPGRHLVFVRYGAHHDFHREWIYNSADVDSAKIVWARELDPVSDAAFARYLASDRVWLLEADTAPPRLTAISR